MKRKPSKREDGMPPYFYGTAQEFPTLQALWIVPIREGTIDGGVRWYVSSHFDFLYLGKRYVFVDHAGEK
jgi:hypothetical protein